MSRRELRRRRNAHLRLYGAGNGIAIIAKTLSKEFGCTEKAIYSDHERMETWDSDVSEDKKIKFEIKARFRLLIRRSMDLVLDDKVKDPFAKATAISVALKVTRAQIRFLQDLGIIERVPLKVETLSDSSMNTPFEADPALRESILTSSEKQTAEKQATQEAIDGRKKEKASLEPNGDEAAAK